MVKDIQKRTDAEIQEGIDTSLGCMRPESPYYSTAVEMRNEFVAERERRAGILNKAAAWSIKDIDVEDVDLKQAVQQEKYGSYLKGAKDFLPGDEGLFLEAVLVPEYYEQL